MRTEAGVESLRRQTGGPGLTLGRIRRKGGKGRVEGAGKREPKGAKGAKDDGGKGVAENPLEDGAERHEDAALKVVDGAEQGKSLARLSFTPRSVSKEKNKHCTTYMLAAPLPPAPRQPMRSHASGVRQRINPATALEPNC